MMQKRKRRDDLAADRALGEWTHVLARLIRAGRPDKPRIEKPEVEVAQDILIGFAAPSEQFI